MYIIIIINVDAALFSYRFVHFVLVCWCRYLSVSLVRWELSCMLCFCGYQKFVFSEKIRNKYFPQFYIHVMFSVQIGKGRIKMISLHSSCASLFI